MLYENHDFGRHHENLVAARKVLKQILWNLSCWQNLPQIFNYGSYIAPGKFVGRNLEQIQVEGCQPHICAQLQLGANFALATIYYSSAY